MTIRGVSNGPVLGQTQGPLGMTTACARLLAGRLGMWLGCRMEEGTWCPRSIVGTGQCQLCRS